MEFSFKAEQIGRIITAIFTEVPKHLQILQYPDRKIGIICRALASGDKLKSRWGRGFIQISPRFISNIIKEQPKESALREYFLKHFVNIALEGEIRFGREGLYLSFYKFVEDSKPEYSNPEYSIMSFDGIDELDNDFCILSNAFSSTLSGFRSTRDLLIVVKN